MTGRTCVGRQTSCPMSRRLRIFCGQFIPITDIDPVLLIAKPCSTPTAGGSTATHEACMRERAEAAGMP